MGCRESRTSAYIIGVHFSPEGQLARSLVSLQDRDIVLEIEIHLSCSRSFFYIYFVQTLSSEYPRRLGKKIGILRKKCDFQPKSC